MRLMDSLKREYDEVNQQHFHVLAVDDCKIDRKLLERLLTVSSYQVTCVDSGDKALEYLGIVDEEGNEYKRLPLATGITCAPATDSTPVSEINLIMTDYSMPGISGYDLLKRIKDSSWKHVPVVVMSSENEPSRINMCLEGGAEEFLLKPVKLSDLRKIHSHLQSSSKMEKTDNFKGEEKEEDSSNCIKTNKRKASQTVSSVTCKRNRM